MKSYTATSKIKKRVDPKKWSTLLLIFTPCLPDDKPFILPVPLSGYGHMVHPGFDNRWQVQRLRYGSALTINRLIKYILPCRISNTQSILATVDI